MTRSSIAPRHWASLLLLAVVAPVVGMVGQHGAARGQQAAPPTAEQQAARLARVGGSVPVESDINTGLRRFEPGNKTYWHSHEGGFILFVHEGRARVQRRGELMKELGPGELDYVPPGVEHWHGAAPNDALIQLGVVPFGGGITFLEPVTDAQYNGQSR